MIGLPFDNNDLYCLGSLTDVAAQLVARRDPWLVALVATFPTTKAFAEWIRSLPQRDDDGEPCDGPKVHACVPRQRLRVFPEDPNCYERTLMYLVGAELIDPGPRRQAATIDLSGDRGRHTIAIEDGVPIVLNPGEAVSELVRALDLERLAWEMPPSSEPAAGNAQAIAPDAIAAAASPDLGGPPVDRVGSPAPGNAGPAVVDIHDALDYTSQLGTQAARNLRNGLGKASRARNAIRQLVDEGVPPRDPGTIDAMGWFFAQAERLAKGYGARALTIVRTTAQAIADLVDDVLAREQRNLSFSIGIPSWLTSAASTVGRIGLDIGATALAPELTALGITGPMLQLVEQELNAEGLTLGPLAHSGQSFGSAAGTLVSHHGPQPRNARAKFFSAPQSCSPRVDGGGCLVRASYRVPPFLADDVLLVRDQEPNSNGRVHCVAWDPTWQERIPARSGWLDRDTLSPVLDSGMRVELNPTCSLWVAGARYGTVRHVLEDWTVIVKMDDPRVRRLQRFTDHTQLTVRPREPTSEAAAEASSAAA